MFDDSQMQIFYFLGIMFIYKNWNKSKFGSTLLMGMSIFMIISIVTLTSINLTSIVQMLLFASLIVWNNGKKLLNDEE